MTNVGKKLLGGLAVALVLGSWVGPAWGIKQFEVEFKKTYYKAESKDPHEKAFAEAVDKISAGGSSEDGDAAKNACNVCHTKGKSKKDRNEYGQKLAELLDKKADKDKPEKIQAALKQVEEMKSSKGPTYGELIKHGKLPGDAK